MRIRIDAVCFDLRSLETVDQRTRWSYRISESGRPIFEGTGLETHESKNHSQALEALIDFLLPLDRDLSDLTADQIAWLRSESACALRWLYCID